jgi:hypothetical protein
MKLLVQQVLAITEKAEQDASAKPNERATIIRAALGEVQTKMLETDSIETDQRSRPLRDFCGDAYSYLLARERSANASTESNRELWSLQSRAEKL